MICAKKMHGRLQTERVNGSMVSDVPKLAWVSKKSFKSWMGAQPRYMKIGSADINDHNYGKNHHMKTNLGSYESLINDLILYNFKIIEILTIFSQL